MSNLLLIPNITELVDISTILPMYRRYIEVVTMAY